AMGLAPEESHPERQGDKNSKTRVNQRWRAHIGIEPDPDTQPPSKQRCPNPDHGAEHPGREKGTNNIDLRSHCAHPCLVVVICPLIPACFRATIFPACASGSTPTLLRPRVPVAARQW